MIKKKKTRGQPEKRRRRKLVEAQTEPEVGINDSQLAARQRRCERGVGPGKNGPEKWGESRRKEDARRQRRCGEKKGQ